MSKTKKELEDELKQVKESLAAKQEQAASMASFIDRFKEMEAKLTALEHGGGGSSVSNFEGMAKAFADAIAEAQRKDATYSPNDLASRYSHQSAIDQDDSLEEPVMFFSSRSNYFVVDDIRGGIPVLPPSEGLAGKKAIHFEPFSTSMKRGDKYDTIEHVCAYKCFSSKTLEWLRNHRLYNLMFFEGSDQIKNIAGVMANVSDEFLKIQHIVYSGNFGRIAKMCELEGLKFDREDPRKSVVELCRVRAERNMAALENRASNAIVASVKESRRVSQEFPAESPISGAINRAKNPKILD